MRFTNLNLVALGRTILVTLFFVTLGKGSISLVSPSFATDLKHAAQNEHGESHASGTGTPCHIKLRALSAGGVVDEREVKKDGVDHIKAPDTIADVKSQLKRLPFKEYEEVATVDGTAELQSSKLFSFVDKLNQTHRVMIAPQRLSAKEDGRAKVSFMINWRGPDDTEYLHTKIGFENGKNMLLGAEQGTGSPLVLCITVKCDESTAR